ncbi:hypothetical protein ACI797_21895 [Geodermatophilus sp. SYSU D00691]
MTRIALDSDGVLRLLARLHGPADGQDLLPLVDADDLHEVDLDAELWNHLPDAPAAGTDR